MFNFHIKNLLILLLSIIIFYFGWVFKNFAICGFGGSFFLLAIALTLKKIKNLSTLLVATAFAISFVELVLNIFWSSIMPVDPKNTYIEKDHFMYERVEGYGYTGYEGSYKQKKLTSDNEIIFDAVYTIGKDGYRLDVPPHDNQIYIYGDSNLFGEGLNDNETLNYFLYKNHNIKSKNMGMRGYGMHQALYNIQKGKTAINGINILLTDAGAATRSACKPSYTVGTPRYIINNNKELILNGVCTDHRVMINKVLSYIHIYKLWNIIYESKNYLDDEDVDIFLAIIKEISMLTKNNNSKLIIAYEKSDMIINSLKESSKYSNESIINEFINYADKAVNLTLAETLEKRPRKYYIHELDMHVTAEANIERAKIIAETINKLSEKN